MFFYPKKCLKLISLTLLAYAFSTPFSTYSQAGWDYELGVSGRTVPFGALFSGTVGYNFLLWGQDPLPNLPLGGASGKSAPWLYGFIRPHFTVQTIGITNRGAFELDVFPISIFGVTFGHATHSRISNPFQGSYCSQFECNGFLNKTYVRAQFIAGAKGFFTMLSGRYDFVSHVTSNLPFVEEASTLVGAAGGDQLLSLLGTVGYTFNDNWMVGAGVYRQNFMKNSDQSNWNNIAYATYYHGQWGFTLGGGTYSSSHIQLSPTAFGMIQYVIKRPLGFFF